MIVYAEVECLLYEGDSLKNKRSLIKRIVHKIRNELNVSIAEIDYQNLWRRIKFGIVTISNEKVHAEKMIQQTLEIIDSFPELERTITHVEQI
ncbi:MAG TPA: DUF503 domain-containing protein [Bacillota bacterium]|nr:DUF503 domain-containing protein [Bacillota bacterium]